MKDKDIYESIDKELLEAAKKIKEHCKHNGCESCVFYAKDGICSLILSAPSIWRLPKQKKWVPFETLEEVINHSHRSIQIKGGIFSLPFGVVKYLGGTIFIIVQEKLYTLKHAFDKFEFRNNGKPFGKEIEE